MNASPPQAYTIPGVDAMPAALAAPLHLAPGGDTAVDLDCDGGRLSSDAGLVRLQDPDEPLGFTRALAAVLQAPRDPRRLHLTLPDLRKHRGWPMAAGSEEANDAHTRRHEPLFKRLRDRRPETGAPWASQPPLSRCDNRVSRTALSRLARVLVDPCLASYARPPQRIVLDCDDTEDPGHGEPEPARYDGDAGGSGFRPLPRYAGRSGRLIPTLFQAQRFPGTPRLSGWKRRGKRRRHAWPDPLVVGRGDRHGASPEVRPGIEAQADRSAGPGLTSHAVLPPLARAVVEQAKRASEREGGTLTRFPSPRYQAGTGSRSRRVVIQGEGSAHGVQTRLGGTDMEQARPTVLSQPMDGARGQAENERKDHPRSRQSERTSCPRFAAHQCRVFLPSAASGVLETLRREGFKTAPGAGATRETIQRHVLTLGARVHEWTDRLTISFPSACPVAPLLRRSLTFFACVRLVEPGL